MNKRLVLTFQICKCEICLRSDSPKTYLKIIRQTCRRSEFNTSVPQGTNLLLLRSAGSPAIEGHTLYVRGSNTERDLDTIVIRDQPLFRRIKDAVLAYNRHNSNNKDIQIEDCFVEIP